MAQVTRPRDDGGNHNRDRGQMILLMGVVLAVMFVALALLVNAAIYTDNVATRGGDPAGEALEYQNGVVDSTEGLIEAENDAGNATADDVRPALENISRYHRQYHLRRGAATETEFDIYQGINETDQDGFKDWTANASDVRGFVIYIDGTRMANSDSPFSIYVGGTKLNVNRTSNEIVVEGKSCSESVSDSIEFNVTSGTLGSDSCDFDFQDFDGGEIEIEDGDNGAGSYELIVTSDENIGSFPSPVKTFIHSIDLHIRIDTLELSYARSVTVAPEGVDA